MSIKWIFQPDAVFGKRRVHSAALMAGLLSLAVLPPAQIAASPPYPHTGAPPLYLTATAPEAANLESGPADFSLAPPPPITTLGTRLAPAPGTMPEDWARERFAATMPVVQDPAVLRQWEIKNCGWQAPGNFHKPLYFEEINAERYGYSYGIAQPAVSAVNFFVRVPVLPYLCGDAPPCRSVYALGYYRPGSCGPRPAYRVPISLHGAVAQGMVVSGLLIAVP